MNENVSILTRLPIYTYWTTNYDSLIETGLQAANRRADVKFESAQLAMAKRDRDAVVYKMHGDANHPATAVLTKDDYVKYGINYPLFGDVLRGDILSKTFLFIGFSFEDPNLDSILNQVLLQLGENSRTHYCFMKRVSKSEEEYETQKIMQDLREFDLRRHGIQVVYVDEYSEITDILKELESAVLSNNIFISGSADHFDEPWSKSKIEELSFKLAKELVKEDFVVSSGFGTGIGSAVINGALDEIYNSKYKQIDEHLCLHPFPQGILDDEERIAKWKKYREEIISGNGVVIFISGNKLINGETCNADGCLEEFEIAKERKCIIIPIGTTGYTAKKVFDEIKKEKIKYAYLDAYFDILETENDVDKIVDAVVEIVKTKRIS